MDSPSDTGVRVIGRRYRLVEKIGSGGMGTVWRAHDELLDRTVAVKEVLLPHVGDVDQELLRARTMREARAAARMSHPHAVTVYDVVEEDGKPWIVMQLVAATSLADEVREKGPLPVGRVAEIGLAVLSALEAAHAAGILHRDVKPGNVLLGHDGRVVLTDFGIATLEGDPSLTGTGLVLGAPAYIAPERARGMHPGPASDLWSLGATLYTAAEGRPPYDRETPLATLTAMISEDPPAPTIGGPLGAALEGLLRREPDRRLDVPGARKLLEQARDTAVDPTETLTDPLETALPQGAGAVLAADAVQAADRTQVIRRPAVPPPPLPAAAAPRRDARRAAVLVAFGLALIAIIVASVLVIHRQRARPSATPGPSGSPKPSPTTSPRSSPPASPKPTTSPTSGAASSSTVPAGYLLYTDPSGFSVAVPLGWQKTRTRPGTTYGQLDFQDPSSGRFLRFGYTTSPKSDPVADWQAQEGARFAGDPSYHRISIAAVDYRNYATADWDFTLGSTRVKDRGFKVDDSHGYAIYLSAAQSQFADSMQYFDTAASSFKPAS